MTLEQLLSPAVAEWYEKFKKNLNESNTTLTPEQMEEEFDKWLIENEQLVNQSVEENKESINESINAGIEALNSLNEGIFDDDAFAEDAEESIVKGEDVEDEPISGEVEGEEEAAAAEELPKTLTGAIRLSSHSKGEPKRNVFVACNALYDFLKKKGIQQEENSLYYRKLNVSDVRDMSALWAFADIANADLSSWDTGNVVHMEGMFYKSSFNNDSICNWNVSSCADFKNMFSFSKFNQSLKKWTPKFIEVIERDADGHAVRDASGSPVKKSVRAELPLIGAAADEESELLAQHWNNIFADMEKEEVKENKMNHVMDFDTFVNEGKVKDFINKGIEKVKGFFQSIALKFGKIVAFFKEDGEMYPAISAYTSLNTVAAGEVPGVSAFCAVESPYLEGVEKSANIVESPEYYGIIDKDSIEYRNYETFKGMINEHYAKYGNTGCLEMINEENFKRVGFSAEEGGLRDIPDINSKQLGMILEDAIKNVPAYKGDKSGGSVLIWGAPGIGKSSIPKSVIRNWNEKQDKFHKKALMVVECGDLTVDGFTLPIPIDKSVSDYLDDRPLVSDVIKASGVSTDNIERIKRNMHKVSTEAPKTWLPCFRVSTNQDEVNILNDIANGHVEKKNKGGLLVVNETTEGGILLMDEFFRADEMIFKILMQLLLTRTYNDEFMLGNKWAIVCCSNRPNDDEEVERGFTSTGAVVGTRFLGGQYNFIPSFDDWKKWAVKEGGFDDVTLEFLMFEKSPEGEYTNWHTIRPEEYTKGKSGWPTPRTWSALMNELNLYKENHGYAEISDIPSDEIRLKADAIIGAEMSKKYVSFLESHSKTAVNVNKILEDAEYKIPSSAKCSEVCRRVENSIKVMYSPDNLPEVEKLMNLFNTLNRTYSETKDNVVKIMHVNIIKFLDVMNNKSSRIALKDYLQAVDKRFHLEEADLK